MQRVVLTLCLLLCIVTAPATADAAIQWITLEGRINGVNDNLGGAFTTTDRLRFTIGYDPATPDISTETNVGTYPGAITSWTIQVLRAGSPIYTAALTKREPTQISILDHTIDQFLFLTGGDNLDGATVNGQHVRSASSALQDGDTSFLPSDDIQPASYFVPIDVPNQHSMRVFFGGAPSGNYTVSAIMDSAVVPEPGAVVSLTALGCASLLGRRRLRAGR